MTAAAPDWLDLRVPFDDDARQNSIVFLDRIVQALESDATEPVTDRPPLLVIDIGAGTGNSARWFDHHLGTRLAGRDVDWVLVDADQQSLDTAVDLMPEAHGVVAPISSLPQIAADFLPAEAEPGRLLITCSAVLDVLTAADINAITETLCRFSGLGLFLLTINGPWHIKPGNEHDVALDDAFRNHQNRGEKLGTESATALMNSATQAGALVETGASPWQLEAPRDREFVTRFFTERVAAAIDEDPHLHEIGGQWLDERFHQLETGLSATIDHLDVFIDARCSRLDQG